MALLEGRAEVPPVSTNATGMAASRIASDGESATFQLVVARLQNTHRAHIHLGRPGESGPIVAWLYPRAPAAADTGRVRRCTGGGYDNSGKPRRPVGRRAVQVAAPGASERPRIRERAYVAEPTGELRGGLFRVNLPD